MKKVVLKMFVVCFLVAGAYTQLQAQPGDPNQDPDLVPLDPGTWVLVAAGVGYGVKKWKESKQQTTEDSNGKSEV